MVNIMHFLGEVSRGIIDSHDYTYNGFPVNEPLNLYQEFFEKLLNDAVSELNSLDEDELETVKYNMIEVRTKLMSLETQNQESFSIMHSLEYGTKLFDSEIYKFYQFVEKCVAIQKECLDKFSLFVSRTKGKATKVTKKPAKETDSNENKKPDIETDSNENTSIEILRDKEWLTAKETATRYPSLAYNNIKSRKWRIRNKFPYEGFDELKGAHNKVMFNSKEVEDWIRNHDIR